MSRFNTNTFGFLVLILFLGSSFVTGQSAKGDQATTTPKVKVFILAGQSNMEGHGQLRSLDMLGNDPKHGQLLSLLKDKDGSCRPVT